MPLNLDSCIAGVFTPGSIGASSGMTPIEPTVPPALPTIASSAAVGNVENDVLAHTLTSNKVVTWSIIGGADAAKFEISGSTLRWLGDGVKDFETPDDADASNTYIVQVRATDFSSNTVDQTVTVTVTDVAEVPPGFADSAMVAGPVQVNGDGTARQANVNGVMINL